MKLTQELIDQIQEAMLHTKKDGSINWKDDDEVVVQLAGTFAADGLLLSKIKQKIQWYLLNHILILIMRRKSLLKMVEKNT